MAKSSINYDQNITSYGDKGGGGYGDGDKGGGGYGHGDGGGYGYEGAGEGGGAAVYDAGGLMSKRSEFVMKYNFEAGPRRWVERGGGLAEKPANSRSALISRQWPILGNG